jgi:transposase
MNYKHIHIGKYIKNRMSELGVGPEYLEGKLKQSHVNVEEMLGKEEISSGLLLRISRILSYDFFRIYSMNLVLYSSPNMGFKKLNQGNQDKAKGTTTPKFSKNTYTPQVISFILDKHRKGELTAAEMIKQYRIPKTTLYRWLKKYNTEENEL